MNDEIKALLKLTHGKGLGRATIWKLIEQFGSASRVLEAGRAGGGELLFRKWEVGDWESDLEEVERRGVKLVSYLDTSYPMALRQINDFPLLLYVKGALPSADTASVAIIGTRAATLYGKEAAYNLGREIAARGVCVVSGLARGIDTAAHEGAVAGGGQTVAVIGSGLSQLYPQENRGLAEKIALTGAVISEYPMHTPPAKGLFPRRNRIVSGMSAGVCLIESPLDGGGMLTMDLAHGQAKPLFAIPGRIDWPTFAGNHKLIKEKKARLVENGTDLLNYLNITQNKVVNQFKHTILTPEEHAFIDQLPNEEKSIEELVLLTQLPMMQLNVLLTRLMLKKVVKEFPGKIYKKVSAWQKN